MMITQSKIENLQSGCRIFDRLAAMRETKTNGLLSTHVLILRLLGRRSHIAPRQRRAYRIECTCNIGVGPCVAAGA